MAPQLRATWRRSASAALAIIWGLTILAGGAFAADEMPSVDEIIAAKTDILGEAAIRQVDGPSYEFFARAMPPLRYVNTAFRHYPIVLAAPRNACKVRLVSNGSAINAQAKQATWRDCSLPVSFSVGAQGVPFGDDLERLDGPRLAEGWLPIIETRYRDGDTVYREEVFASVDAALADHGVAFVRFSLDRERSGKVIARLTPAKPLHQVGRNLCNDREEVCVAMGPNWQWDAAQQALTADVAANGEAVLAVFTTAIPKPSADAIFSKTKEYQQQRAQCAAVWRKLLAKGVTLETPEPVVNNAWRAATAANLMVVTGATVNYSAGNNYYQEYITEGSRTVGAFMLFGFINESQPMLLSLLDHSIPAHKYAVTGWKLRTLAHYYWLTRDAAFMRANRSRWEPLVKLILDDLDPQTGLTPKDFYASDIHEPVWNLKTNANCWCGVRSLAAVLRDMGAPRPEWERRAAEYRQAIFRAVDKSVYRDCDPPFVPNALLSKAEKPYETLTQSTTGSYWCLVANDMLGSGVFAARPETAAWILDTLHRRGGVALGMLRFDQHSKLFANERGVDDNYTTGYMLHLLQRDEADRGLVCFYGKLAQGFTRDTFVGGEGTSFDALDKFGRPMYLPPCTAGNAFYLWTLRHLLVQDWDTDDDGAPDTLRLLYAVPRRWFRDGAALNFTNAPTAFGPLSLATEAKLAQGEFCVRLTLPPRQPAKTLLRARVPEGWQAVSATVGNATLPVDGSGAVDLTGQSGRITVRFRVQKVAAR